ncbi:MAG: hypothetical protein SFT93_00695 [Rickettsiaceae bacterium]|nr:hypothetical protein [Rickettsiaceae bacterium]
MTKKDAGMTIAITVSSPRKRGSSRSVIPSKEGIQELYTLDSRLRGNDKIGCGNDNSECLCYGVIQVSFTCHPRENGDPVEVSSPRRRGSRKDKKDWIPASAGMTK